MRSIVFASKGYFVHKSLFIAMDLSHIRFIDDLDPEARKSAVECPDEATRGRAKGKRREFRGKQRVLRCLAALVGKIKNKQ